MAPFYKAMLQEREDLKAEGRQLMEQAERTAEDSARLEEIATRLGALNPQIEAEEALREQLRQTPAAGTAAPTTSAGRPAGRITGMHDNAGDRPWGSLGEFLQGVATAGTPGARVDPRLYEAAASGASQGVPSDGGFLVGTDYSTALINRAVEASPILPLCDEIPIGAGSDGIEAPYVEETSRATGSRWGGVRVYRRGEADTVTSSKPKFGMFDLRLEDIMGLAYATERLLGNAPALETIFGNGFVSEFNFKITDEIVRGTGAGECLGLLNAPALLSVAKETGQAAATVVMENISKMWNAMPARNRGSAVWIYNQDVEPQLDLLTLSAGAGALEPRFVTYGPDGAIRIKGRPVIALEQCETLGTVGDFMLVDFSEYAVITKGALQADQSIHVRFLYNERAFRWIYQINGAPKQKTALTPYKGATKRSPYVALATRA